MQPLAVAVQDGYPCQDIQDWCCEGKLGTPCVQAYSCRRDPVSAESNGSQYTKVPACTATCAHAPGLAD